MRSSVVKLNSLIYGLLELSRRAVYHEAYLLLDSPLEAFDFSPALGMVGCAKDMLNPMAQQILRKDL